VIVARIAAFIAGLILVAAAANGTVSATGGYGTPQSYTTLAMALGVVVGAGVIGYVRNKVLVVCLVAGLFAGEAFAFLATANRVVTAAEASQAPLRDAARRHQMALDEVTAAEAAKPSPAPRDRLDAAERAKNAADEASRTKASEMGCRKNCADMLTAAVNAAAREVEAARAEIEAYDAQQARLISDRIAKARAALDAAPLPPSATPFADRVGISPWALDLAMAGLLSFGLNLMAAGLISFATHASKTGEPKIETVEYEDVKPLDITPTNVVQLPPAVTGAVSKFMLEQIEAAPRSRVEVADLFAAYKMWCEGKGCRPLSVDRFADDLTPVLEAVGIPRKEQSGHVYLVGIKLAS
jgi:hypothetical protein